MELGNNIKESVNGSVSYSIWLSAWGSVTDLIWVKISNSIGPIIEGLYGNLKHLK